MAAIEQIKLLSLEKYLFCTMRSLVKSKPATTICYSILM